jgi:N-acetylmuramoyl-L-alanine amidase
MKFGIDSGHNVSPDTGAVGIKDEDSLTLDVGNKLRAKLAAAGHTVVNCTPNSASSVQDSLRKRVDKANSNAVDIFVSIHFNKFLNNETTDNPMGSEVYALSNTSAGIGQTVLNKIADLGFRSRKVKSVGYFVLRNTSMPAILIEVCFLDSTADMALLDSVGTDAIAEAIKEGLIGDHQDTSDPSPGILIITTQTVLKPSTEQSDNLPSDSLVKIEPGSYPVLDSGFEENHWRVKWPSKIHANRDQHFIFKDHGHVSPQIN